MKTVFMGTPAFAAETLKCMCASGFAPVLVFTQKDKEKNRGMKLLPSEVKQAALDRGIPVVQPDRVKDELEHLKALAPDVIVVAAYGKLLPQSVLDVPKYGCINVHASLLPKYRGASPITAAIAAGETKTGISIMKMEAGLDTGAVFCTEETQIFADDTYGTLHDRLAEAGGRLAVKTLLSLESGDYELTLQDEAQASYAPKVTNANCVLRFCEMSASKVSNVIRAYDPKPGAYAVCDGQKYKLFRPVICEKTSEEAPGTVYMADKKTVSISCTDGDISVGEIQAPGGKRMAFCDFLRGFRRSLRFE